jgi:hypothetical protein
MQPPVAISDKYTHSNTLLLENLNERSQDEIERLFAQYGQIRLIRLVPRFNIALIIYSSELEARHAKQSVRDETVHFTKVSIYFRSQSLAALPMRPKYTHICTASP